MPRSHYRRTHPRRWPSVPLLPLLVVGGPLSAAQEVDPPPWTLEETLRIGSVDGPVPLTSVRSLVVGPEGRLYVDQMGSEILVLSGSGDPIGTIGRAGQGPGEFQGSTTGLGLKGDTLWVSDAGGGTHFFERDGTFISRVSFQAPFREAEGVQYRPSVPLADGTFLALWTIFDPEPLATASDPFPVRTFTREGEVADTLLMLEDWRARWLGLPHERLDQLFASHPLWHTTLFILQDLPPRVSADHSSVLHVGSIRADGPNPSFELLRAHVSGEMELIREIPFDPEPISAEMGNWIRENFGAVHAGDFFLSDIGMDEPTAERRRREAMDALTLPDFLPPVRHIVAGRDGSIWLLRELRMDGVDRWEVYDEEGRLQGEVHLDEGRGGVLPWQHRGLLWATVDEIWVTTLDGLDVPYIHRYRVNREGGG